MKRGLAAFVFLIILFFPLAADSGNRWSLDIRGGAAFATQNMGDASLGSGLGFEAVLAYRLLPRLAAYAGWDGYHFATARSFAGSDVDVEDTGYVFGLQFIHPFGGSSLDYFIRAGAIFNHIEIEHSNEQIIADSKHGLGWEIGLGLVYTISAKWKLTPGIRYRSLARYIEIGAIRTPVKLAYLNTEVGCSFIF